MHLDPPLQFIADLLGQGREAEPPSTDLGARRLAARNTMLAASIGREGASATETTVPADGRDIPVRVMRPDGLAAPSPAVLYIHGGGWFQGDLDTAEVECGPLASRAGVVVVLVDYRLAPEHPFPAALDDCVAVYEWMLASAAELGIDPGRIIVGGASAGGNLAAALCLALRDRGTAPPLLQLLEVPATDLAMESPSLVEFATGAGLTGAEVDQYARWYVGEDGDRRHPYVSPLHAPDLSGLPPALIIVSELDPIRDDGERYLAALHAAGVAGAAFRVLAHFHGGWIVPNTMTHRLILDLRAAAVREAVAGTLVPPLLWQPVA